MFLNWIALPVAASMTDQVGTYTTVFFDQFWFVGLAIVGIMIGVLFAKLLFYRVPMRAVKSFVGGGRRRRGRRR